MYICQTFFSYQEQYSKVNVYFLRHNYTGYTPTSRRKVLEQERERSKWTDYIKIFIYSHSRSIAHTKTHIPSSAHTPLALSRFIKWGNIKVMFPKATLYFVHSFINSFFSSSWSFKFLDGMGNANTVQWVTCPTRYSPGHQYKGWEIGSSSRSSRCFWILLLGIVLAPTKLLILLFVLYRVRKYHRYGVCQPSSRNWKHNTAFKECITLDDVK